jgi:hypothetical protein
VVISSYGNCKNADERGETWVGVIALLVIAAIAVIFAVLGAGGAGGG